MRSSAAPSCLPLPARGGFTLAEIVVALVLLACGALALVAASSGAVRAVGAAEAQARATMAARNRVEGVASTSCSSLSDGTAVESSLALREHWRITPVRNGVRLVTDTVEYTERDGVGMAVVLHRLLLC